MKDPEVLEIRKPGSGIAGLKFSRLDIKVDLFFISSSSLSSITFLNPRS